MPDNRKKAFLQTLGIDNQKKKELLDNEFEQASLYFNTYGQPYTKLPRTNKPQFKARLKKRHPDIKELPQTTHSFFCFNGLIVCTLPGGTNGIIGAGTFGIVNFCYSQQGQVLVIKKEFYDMAKDRKKDPLLQTHHRNELTKSKNVGLLQAFAYRKGHKKDFSKRERKYRPHQSYLLMTYLGRSLYHYLIEQEWLHVKSSNNFSIAAHLMWQAFLLHSGYLCQDGEKLALRDIKPENVIYKPKAINKIKFIDFAFAAKTSAPAYAHTGALIGTIDYISLDWEKITAEEADIFALLRTIYIPEIYDTPLDNSMMRTLNEYFILTDKEYNDIPLNLRNNYLNTESGHFPKRLKFKKANFLAALFALLAHSHLEVQKVIAMIQSHEGMQNTIAFLFMADVLKTVNTSELIVLLTKSHCVKALSSLAPAIHVLPKTLLSKIYREYDMTKQSFTSSEAKVLLTIIALPPKDRFKSLRFIEACFELNHTSQVLNYFNQPHILNYWLAQKPAKASVKEELEKIKTLCQQQKSKPTLTLSMLTPLKAKPLTPKASARESSLASYEPANAEAATAFKEHPLSLV